jgi:hypothetical protein
MEIQRYGIKTGVKVSEIKNGLIKRMGIPEDFIFVKFNGKDCEDPVELIKELSKVSGRIQIEGIGPDGARKFFNFYGY